MEKLGKGFKTEEHLRDYFLRAGYFVVRGVPFKYAGFDVTDIDLWLCGRASSVSREIAIVDVKNKKTPQAIERIFWVKGLKEAVYADQAIVATSEKRKEVKDFGKKLDVVVLDKSFLSRLDKTDEALSVRLSDEEFYENISAYQYSKIYGDWKSKIENAKGLLASGLNFDTANAWLDTARYFAEQSLVSHIHSETALRCFYLVLSFFALCVDYILKEVSFLDTEERRNALSEGFQYGSSGKSGVDDKINMSLALVEKFYENGDSVSRNIKQRVKDEFEAMDTKILGEFFSKGDVFRSLFYSAKELEDMAMRRDFSHFSTASVGVKSLIGCLFDFWGLSRSSLVQRNIEI